MSGTLRRRLPAYIRLVRLSNSVPAALLVILGAYLANGALPPREVWLAAVVMWSVTGFGYASNDLWDRWEDGINKPDRPLPAGRVTPRSVALLCFVLAGAALTLAGSIGSLAVAAVVTVLALLVLYSALLKGLPLVGNLLIALLAGCTLLVGAYLVDEFDALLIPAGTLAAFIATRETLKTVEDVDGDRAAGRRTVAVQWGVHRGLQVAGLFAGLTVLLSFLPVIALGFRWGYLAAMVVGVDGVLLYVLLRLGRHPTPERVREALALLKGSYFAGILALFLA